MYDDDGVKIGSRYTISYEGPLFYEDGDGWNSHDYDSWYAVQGMIQAYGDIIEVRDNLYGVTWSHGEWN